MNSTDTVPILHKPSEEFKTIVEERTDDQGRRMRVTRKVKLRLVTEKVSDGVAARCHWKKFGDAANDGPGPNSSSTIVGEAIFLKLSLNKDLDREPSKAPVVEAKNITCQYCQGAHWSARCPYKATFMEEAKGNAAAAAATAPEKSTKYIPPSMRKALEEGTPMPTNRDNPNTVRLSNLSEITTEADIRDLVTRIAPVSRVFVPKDPRTGLCRGSAFVSFMSMHEVERVIQVLDGRPYGNLIIKAELAKPQAP